MRLNVSTPNRMFSVQAEWVITQDDMLVAASIGGIGTAVKAVLASIIEGRFINFYPDSKFGQYLETYKNGYRKFEAQNGDTTHGVILHKDAIIGDHQEAPIIIAFDGNIKKAVGEFLAAKYTLPNQWIDEYYSLIPITWVEHLTVYSNPLSKKHKKLWAARISSNLTEEYILNEISKWLKDGSFVIPKPKNPISARFDPSWDMATYLKENAEILATQIEEIKPLHNPETDPVDPAIAEMRKIPFPVQAHMITALVKAIEQRQKGCFLNGDMGTGKTLISLGVAHVLHTHAGKGIRVLLAVPSLTIPKWAEDEIPEALNDAKVTVINSTDDALKIYGEIKRGSKPLGLEFYIVSTDRAKLGPENWFAGHWKRVRGEKTKAWHCPDCGEALIDPKTEKEEEDCIELAGWEVVAQGLSPEDMGVDTNGTQKTSNLLPKTFPVEWKKKSKLKKCQHCGAKLWRPALKARGETRNRPRWYICRILKRLRKQFKLFIQDEVQQVKAQDSGRGDSFAQLVKAAENTLSLTGTLTNGKSTSIKNTIWRTDPKALLEQGVNHETGDIAWAERYGVLERVVKVDNTDVGIVTRRKTTKWQPKEKPGIAPEMTATYLLHKTGFLELGDLGLPLVEIEETPVFVDLDEEHREVYVDFHEQLKNMCQNLAAAKVPGAWSRFTPATINYADRPDLGAYVDFGEYGEVTAPKFPEDEFNAKERKAVQLVLQELAQDRGVAIFCNYTSKYGVNQRLQKALLEHGVKAEVLEASVSPEKRVAWLKRQEEKGTKVIISNMTLLEVGLDLLQFPTIINYQLTDNVYTLRQASRRAWRIGQDRACKVFYMVANETEQVAQFKRVMAGRGHAMLVEGRIDRSELANFARDRHSALAADIADCLADTALAQKWQQLAEKDLDPNIKLVSEVDFKLAVKEAQRELVRKTLELCGRDAEIEITNPVRKHGLSAVQVRLIEARVRKKGKLTDVVQYEFAW